MTIGRGTPGWVGAAAALAALAAAVPSCAGRMAVVRDRAAPAAEVSSTPAGPPRGLYPVPDWTRVGARAAGMDRSRLDAARVLAARARSRCLLVSRGGALVGEWYWRGFRRHSRAPVWSVTKSVTSTLVGIAQDRGLLALDDRVSEYVTEWRGTPSESVTVRQLLALDSGRHWDQETDYVRLPAARDQTRFAIELPGISAPQPDVPGTRWVYNNAAIQVLDRVISRATGTRTVDFARQALFEPLGMDPILNVDWHQQALVYGGLRASCRDLLRFALLIDRRGWWNGSRVVSEAWVAESTDRAASTNGAYGLMWWLNRPGKWETPSFLQAGRRGEGPIFGRDLPETFVLARGNGEQLVGIFPDLDLVFVRLGDPAGDRFVQQMSEAVFHAVR